MKTVMKALYLILMLAGSVSTIGFSPFVTQAQQTFTLPGEKPNTKANATTNTKSQLSDYRMRAFGLSGITLNDEQKAQLDSVRKEYMTQYKAFTARVSTNRVNANIESTNSKDGKRSFNAEELASLKDISKSQFGAIRKILTPTQQRQFDENVRELESNPKSMELPKYTVSSDSTMSVLIPTPNSKDKNTKKNKLEDPQ